MALDTVIVKFQADVDSLRKELEGVKKQLKDTEDQAEETGKALEEEVGGAANTLSTNFKKLGGIIAGAFAAREVLTFIKDIDQLARKAEGVTKAFTALNDKNLLNELKEATKGTVSELQLMQAAVKASNFKIPLEQLGKLLKFAQERARATGESVDYLVESIVTGIGRKSPMILDNLGISAVSLKENLKGVGLESASVGDIAESVGKIIDESMGKATDSTTEAADAADRAAARYEDLKVELGTRLIPVLTAFREALIGIISATTASLDATDAFFSTLGQGFKVITSLLKGQFQSMQIVDLRARGLLQLAEEQNAVTQQETIPLTQEQIDAYNKLAEELEKVRMKLKMIREEEEKIPSTVAQEMRALEAQQKLLQQQAKNRDDANKTLQEYFDIWNGGSATDADLANQEFFENLIARQEQAKLLGDDYFSALIFGLNQLTDIQTNNAAFQKQMAFFQILIAQAEAIAGAVKIATSASSNPISYFAVLATVLASITKSISGAKQLLNVPVPQAAFAEGVVDLKGRGTETSDSILARLSKGESVITAKATRLDKGLFEAANKLQLEDYITKNYVLPVLREQEKESQAAFDDYRLYLALVKGQSKDERNTTRIVQAIKETGVRRYDWN